MAPENDPWFKAALSSFGQAPQVAVTQPTNYGGWAGGLLGAGLTLATGGLAAPAVPALAGASMTAARVGSAAMGMPFL